MRVIPIPFAFRLCISRKISAWDLRKADLPGNNVRSLPTFKIAICPRLGARVLHGTCEVGQGSIVYAYPVMLYVKDNLKGSSVLGSRL